MLIALGCTALGCDSCPLESLAGRWEAPSGRQLDAVWVEDRLEFRVIDPARFFDQDYRAGETRFILRRIAGEKSTFAVEDHLRPLPPYGLSYHSAAARASCLGIWRRGNGRPLRASFNGSTLTVDFAKVQPRPRNFVTTGKVVEGCRELDKLEAEVLPIALKRVGRGS